MNLLWREALLAFHRTRTLSVLSITTIAFALFVSGLFGLVAVNLDRALKQVQERVEVVAFIARGTPTQTIAVASQDIAAFPEVLDVRYVSEDDALERARNELIEFQEAKNDLDVNPLPPSLEISLREEHRNSASTAAVSDRLRSFTFIEDVQYGRDWVEQLDRIRNLAGLIGIVIGLAFAVVSIVIIGVTIRMTILQRAREIRIMRLVGATDWFVRGPFLLEGAIKGFLGGALAVGMCALVYTAFHSREMGMTVGLEFFSVPQQLMLIGFGVLIGLGGSLISVGRHLRQA